MSENMDAQAVLLDKVFVPAFFAKLAEAGIVPQSQADANELLQMADMLQVADQTGITKAASEMVAQPEADGFLKLASARLRDVVAQVTAPQDPEVLAAASAVAAQ